MIVLKGGVIGTAMNVVERIRTCRTVSLSFFHPIGEVVATPKQVEILSPGFALGTGPSPRITGAAERYLHPECVE
jgi:hypothetical protein